MADPSRPLSIGDLAAATGVAVGTLRMWESRHGFPVARRQDGGHRRYDSDEIARVARVVEARREGLSLAAAIDRVRDWTPSAPPSLFAALRAHQPELQVHRLPVRAMRAISHAIEDECLARAARPLLAGSFQRERAYRRVEHRWRELARTARMSFVIVDFPRRRTGRGRPAEVPLPGDSPLAREWAVICVDARFSACLTGWEPPTLGGTRCFEAIWSTDPAAVRAAMQVALNLAGGTVAARGAAAIADLGPSAASGSEPALALANRVIDYLAGGCP
jgi:DNA-binding transcriptional MerR regulator